jgi:hypothetical protein
VLVLLMKRRLDTAVDLGEVGRVGRTVAWLVFVRGDF